MKRMEKYLGWLLAAVRRELLEKYSEPMEEWWRGSDKRPLTSEQAVRRVIGRLHEGFTSTDVYSDPKLKGLSRAKITNALKNIVAAGEIRVTQKGKARRPNIYEKI